MNRDERGFTFLETIVSMGLLGLLFVAVLPAFHVLFAVHGRNEIRSEALAAAQQAVETLRRQDVSALPTSGSTGPVMTTVGDRTYEVLTRYCLTPALCDAATRHLAVEVRLGARLVYTVETVFTVLNG